MKQQTKKASGHYYRFFKANGQSVCAPIYMENIEDAFVATQAYNKDMDNPFRVVVAFTRNNGEMYFVR